MLLVRMLFFRGEADLFRLLSLFPKSLQNGLQMIVASRKMGWISAGHGEQITCESSLLLALSKLTLSVICLPTGSRRICLSTGTGRVLAELILRMKPSIDLNAFSL